jgi:hypothetical protein
VSDTAPSSVPIPSLALIPYYGPAPHAHYESVRKSGIRVASRLNDSSIDAARATLLETGLRQEGVDVFVFIDSDVEFTREGYDRIARSCSETEGVVGGVYLSKSLTGSGILIGTPKELPANLEFYEKGQLYPAKTLGMGFTAIHRKAVEVIATRAEMQKIFFPIGVDSAMLCYPLFMPLVRERQYIREDYSFCLRASAAGVPLHLDTRVELIHHGEHGYRIEDSAYRSVRHEDLAIQISGAGSDHTRTHQDG